MVQAAASSSTFIPATSTTTTASPQITVDFKDSQQGLRAGIVPLGLDPATTLLLLHMDTATVVSGSTYTTDSTGNHLDALLECKTPGGGACSDPTYIPSFVAFAKDSSRSAFGSVLQMAPGGENGFFPMAAVPDGAVLDSIYTGAAFTLEAWFSANPPDNNSGTYVIAGQGNESARAGYYIGISSYNTASPQQTSLVGSINGTSLFSSTIPFNTSLGQTWDYAALSWDGATARLYLNGKEVANAAGLSLTQPAAGTPFTVGALLTSANAVQHFYDGQIDDVKLSNVALSADQIASSYFSGALRYSANSVDGTLGSGSWTYLTDPSLFAISVDSHTPPQESTSTAVGGVSFRTCSLQNWAAFLTQDVQGHTGVLAPFQVFVATALPQTPAAPTNSAISSNALSWAFGTSDPCAFDIVYSTGLAGGPTVIVATQPVDVSRLPNNFSVSMAGLTPNTSYQFQILAFDTTGQSQAIAASTYTLAAAPTGLALTFVSSQTLSASWNTNGNPSYTRYQVSYGRVGVSEATSTVVTTSSFTTLSNYAALGVPISSSTAQFLYVQAINQFGNYAPVLASAAPAVSTTTLGAFQQGSFHPQDIVQIQGLLSERSISLGISSGTFDQDYTVTIVDTGTAPCGPVIPGGSTAAISILIQPQLQPKLPLSLTMGYKPSEAAGAAANLLGLVRYDAATGVCVPLVTQNDSLNRTLSAEINHLSSFQILQSSQAPSDLEAARVFPNPLYMSRGQGYMTLRQLPAGARIRIYTLRGELVYETHADASGSARWNAVNASGFGVASGVYLALFEAGSSRKILKLAVER